LQQSAVAAVPSSPAAMLLPPHQLQAVATALRDSSLKCIASSRGSRLVLCVCRHHPATGLAHSLPASSAAARRVLKQLIRIPVEVL
jgi:hypothetical protein